MPGHLLLGSPQKVVRTQMELEEYHQTHLSSQMWIFPRNLLQHDYSAERFSGELKSDNHDRFHACGAD